MAWWLRTDPEFGSVYGRVVRPKRDIGVDLRAFPKGGGKPTAVQCKQWRGQLRKSEIDSFLSAAATDEYAGSLLIHTGSGLSPNAEATIATQRTPCVVLGIERLLRSDVIWPASIDALNTGARRPAREPRPHQEEALDRIRSAYRRERERTWVQMACGTGKTLVWTLVADEFAPCLAVVFVATTTALHETVRAWRRDARVSFAEIRVCSKDDSEDPESDDIGEAAASVTTSPADIAQFLGGDGRRVVFCTYASAPRLVGAMERASAEVDLIVADDVHTIASRRRSATAKAVLDNDRLRSRRRLFMTATPRVWKTDALEAAARRGAVLVDMRDSVHGDFGARAYYLSHREAVRREIVLPFEVHIVRVTTDEVDRVVASKRLIAAEGHSQPVLASLAATQVAVAKAAVELPLRRIVAFHSRVPVSKLFADSFAATAALVSQHDGTLELEARHVDGYRHARRRRAISWFMRSDGACLLSNQRLLADGVDHPEIDSIIWNDPHAPPERVVQAVGRALRPSGDKTKAIVIVPMIVGPDGNVEKVREHSTFAATIRILDALRSIDPDFARTRESLRFYAAKRQHDPSSRYLKLSDLTVAPLEVTNAFADAIEHLLLPPKAATPTTPPRWQERRSPPRQVVSSSEVSLPPPKLRSNFSDGLNRLERQSGDGLLCRLTALEDVHWLAELRSRYSKRGAADDDLVRIAAHLSFLADGLGPSFSELRVALANRTDRSIPVHLATWVRCRPRASYAHQLCTVARAQDWQLEYLAGQLLDLLTHAGLNPIERAGLCLRPLIAAAAGLGRNEDPDSRLGGLLSALHRPWDPEPPQTRDGWRADASTDAARADWATYVAGWEAGQRWRIYARLIDRLVPRVHEGDIAKAIRRDARRPVSERWDYTSWAMFINELARTGGDVREAERRASQMSYASRARSVRELMSTPPTRLAEVEPAGRAALSARRDQTYKR